MRFNSAAWAVLFLFFFSVPAFAKEKKEDARAKALREYQEEVDKAYHPVNSTEEAGFYSRMEREADELRNVNDYIQAMHDDADQQKDDKLLKPLKSARS